MEVLLKWAQRQHKTFFNLKKIKKRIAPHEEGDLEMNTSKKYQ